MYFIKLFQTVSESISKSSINQSNNKAISIRAHRFQREGNLNFSRKGRLTAKICSSVRKAFLSTTTTTTKLQTNTISQRGVTLEVVNKRHKIYKERNVFQGKRNQKLGVAQSPSHRKILNSEYVTQTQKTSRGQTRPRFDRINKSHLGPQPALEKIRNALSRSCHPIII